MYDWGGPPSDGGSSGRVVEQGCVFLQGGAGRSSPPLHKYRDRPYVNRRNQEYRGRGRPRLDYRKLTHSQLKEMEMARLEMPRPEKKEVKDQGKKSGGGKRVREGNEEEKEEEGKEEGAARSGSPVQEGKQR